MSTVEACLACGLAELAFFATRSTARMTFEIRQCRGCGSAFAFPRPSREEMESYYGDPEYAPQTLADAVALDRSYYPDSAMDATRIVGRCLQFGAGSDFTDIGAGFGFFSKEAMARGYRVTSIEPNPNAASALREYTGIEPLQAPLSVELGQDRQATADVVLLSQVLEHLPDIDRVVLTVRDLLRPGGLAAVAVPHFGSALSKLQGRNDMYLTPPEHINFLTIRGIKELFSRFGFSSVYIETVTKVPKGYSRHILPLRFAGGVGWRILYGCLHACDSIKAGMIINAYFRKGEE